MLFELRLDQPVDGSDTSGVLTPEHRFECSLAVRCDAPHGRFDPGDLLANHGIVRISPIYGQSDNLVDGAAVAELVGEKCCRALVPERCPHNGPALALFAESVGHRNLDIVEEDLREVVAAGRITQRTNLDTRRIHRDQQVSDTCCSSTSRAGPHECKNPVSLISFRRPDLLPRNTIDVTVTNGTGRQ